MSPEEIRARGWEYWQKIYTSGSQALLDGMHRGYPDMGTLGFPELELIDRSLLCRLTCVRSADVILRLSG